MNKFIFNSILNGPLKKIIFMFFLFIGTVLSDVVLLPTGNLINGFPAVGAPVIVPNTFASFVTTNANVMPNPQNNLFIQGINWQMLGYAAFFPINGVPLLYSAQKRPFNNIVNPIPNNDPGNPPNWMNLFNYDTNMHTERQLVIAALSNHLNPFPVVANGGANIIIGGLNIPNIINVGVFNIIPALQGDLHIYTVQNPCQNSVADNGNFSCISYYNALANFIPGLNLHIYFARNNMRLNRNFFSNNNAAANNLCNFIQMNLIQGFQINGGWLQINRHGHFQNLIQQTATGWNIATAQVNGKINILVTQVNNAIIQNQFSNLQLDRLFNTVHNTNNLHNITYHPI